MEELDHKESWVPKNWCFWIVVLEKILESPLDSKEIQPVSPRGNQSWIFIGRNDAEAETPILWPPDAKNWLIWKDTGAGKDWRLEKRGRQRMRWLDGITDSMDMSRSKLGRWWWTKKPGVLWSMGSQRVSHDCETKLNWPTPVSLPKKFHGQRSLTGYITWGHKESDTAEQLTLLLLQRKQHTASCRLIPIWWSCLEAVTTCTLVLHFTGIITRLCSCTQCWSSY